MSWWVISRVLLCIALTIVVMGIIARGLTDVFEGSVVMLLTSINAAILALRENKSR